MSADIQEKAEVRAKERGAMVQVEWVRSRWQWWNSNLTCDMRFQEMREARQGSSSKHADLRNHSNFDSKSFQAWC